ncbi:hypothetical protein [Duganella sp. Root1480D1]|uniref:hypothetical protein n=1 Tax=Duganella sp. Root1480D1 TaxID=1736471 RepID=UPI00070EE4B0|nr:hypothetical protein [Duganella sp. Root1480D1]KQZ35116.1 hypothetical protein ASD58_28290 [Duganella sp. Root1480D1]
MKLFEINWTAIFDKLLDPYEVKARLFPGLLVLLPAILYFVLLHGSKSPVVVSLGTVLATCGGPYLLSNFVRTWGQRVQERLFRDWGGQPSTIMLRHRDSTLSQPTKLKYHALALGTLGIPMPSAQDEESNPDAADQSYAAAADALRPLTNDKKKFPFVFKELVAYGFNRNAYGARWVGLGVCIASAWATLTHANAIRHDSPYLNVTQIGNAHAVVLLIAFGVALLWSVHFTADTVRISGLSYSRRLWEALEKIPKKPVRKTRATFEAGARN